LSIDTRVGVVTSAIALADGHLDLIGASGPRLLLGWLGVEFPRDGVRADVLALVELAVAHWHVLWWLNIDAQEAWTDGLDDLVDDSEGEFGSLWSLWWRDDRAGDVDDTASDDWAHVELLADENGVWVLVVDEVEERLNADIIANEVATDLLDLVWQLTAESAARADDSTVQNDLQQLVDGVVHELNAERTQVKLWLVVLDWCDDGLDWEGADGDLNEQKSNENFEKKKKKKKKTSTRH